MNEPDDLSQLQQRLAVLERREQRRARLLRWLGLAAALAIVAYNGVSFAANGNCPNGYPFCFGAGSPALASQVNHNFAQIKEWVEQKVGAVGSNNVAVPGSLTVGGGATVSGNTGLAGTLTVTGATSVGNGLTVTSGGLSVTGNLSATGNTFGCYTHWGDYGCASGFDTVLNGHTGGLESHSSTSSTFYSNVECVSDSATVLQSFAGTTYFTRLMRSEADGAGMDLVRSRCSTCCRGGCYTAYGQASCASGYSLMYSGRVGGIEAYDGQEVNGKTLCVDTSPLPLFTWGSGYTNRLMRHRDGANNNTGNSDGMDSVTNSCAVCCR